MKKIIRGLFILFITLSFSFITIINVYAAGTVTINLNGSSTVSVDQNITLTITLSNIAGATSGIGAFQSTLEYDTDYFDFVSRTQKCAPSMGLSFNTSTAGKVIVAGADNDTGLSGSTIEIWEVVLKAKKTGTTTVNLNAIKIKDGATIPVTLTHSPNTISKSITIGTATTTTTTTTTTTPSTSSTTTTTKSTIKSSNNNLSALEVDGYTISPTFNKNTLTYNVTIPNTAEEINIKATKDDSKASISGTGAKPVAVGSSSHSVVVTAEDGSTKTYTINVTRETASSSETKSSDAALKGISVNGYSLSPSFDKNTTNYTLSVPDSVNTLDINALTNDPKAKVEIIGNNLTTGTNNVMIKVTAEDGTDKYYVITVKKGDTSGTSSKNSNNYLNSLDIKNVDLDYNKAVNSYSITVPYETSKLDLTALPENSKSVVTVSGNSNFKVGEVNTVEVRVTAEDGSLRIYTLNVYRSPISSKNQLSELDVAKGSLSPSFDPSVEEYNLTVPNSVKDLELFFKTKDSNATVEVLGNKDLSVGQNVVKVKVTDANGFTRTYTINVEKEAPFKILGINPWIAGILGVLLLTIPFFLIPLLGKKKKEEPIKEHIAPAKEKEEVIIVPDRSTSDTQPTINFSPVINIGSQNDSEISGDNAKKLYNSNSNNTTEAKNDTKQLDYIVPEYDELDYKEAEYSYNLDDLMDALKNQDSEKLTMFRKQIEADELKDELKGLDPDRNDDLFDDEVTIREVIKAIDNYEETGDSRPIELLIKQYEANKYRDQNEFKYKSRSDRYRDDY